MKKNPASFQYLQRGFFSLQQSCSVCAIERQNTRQKQKKKEEKHREVKSNRELQECSAEKENKEKEIEEKFDCYLRDGNVIVAANLKEYLE